MHIVQVSSYYPPHLGGQEHAVQDLAQQLAQAGHQVQAVTSTEGNGPLGSRMEHGVQVERLPGFVFGHAPIMPRFLGALSRLASKNSIVHLHIGQAFTPEMVWLASKLIGFKYIAQLHIDFEPSGPAGILLPLYKRFILKHALRAASAVIVLNERTLQVVREVYGYKGRAEIMNNGLDGAYFNLKRSALPPQPPRTLHLLFVGRLSKQKNIGALFGALHETKRRVQLDIIGEGEERDLVKKLIKTHGLTNVTLRGRLDRTKVMKFYETCDALIMPSLYEAQPLVLLEAMAAGIPIIGTNVIGVEDHIKRIGIVVEPTAKGLASGIEQFYSHYGDLPHMVRRGRDKAGSLRWSNMLKKYEALYENVLAS